jgi:predicted nucleic acid-binding protein
VAIYFFDSSGLVKRYVAEVGSSWVQGITHPSAGHRIHIAQITKVEVIAAISRRILAGHTSKTDAALAIANFRYDYVHQYNPLEITDHIIDSATTLAESHTLRAYDAVQLAVAVDLSIRINAQNTALGIPASVAPSVTIISSDSDLNNAAVIEKLNVEDPRNYP